LETRLYYLFAQRRPLPTTKALAKSIIAVISRKAAGLVAGNMPTHLAHLSQHYIYS
jgi:hypothetical protein